jgi:formate dehydrogenase subunit delta
MKTTVERLVHMANQIAAHLTHEPDPVSATAQHMAAFWDPRMKAMIAAAGIDGLSPVAAAAVARLHVGA